MLFIARVNGRGADVVHVDATDELAAASLTVAEFEQRIGTLPCGTSVYVWVRPEFVAEHGLVIVTCKRDGEKAAEPGVELQPPRVIH